MLKIAVHRDNHVTGRGVESGRERGRLTVVPRQLREPHARVALGNRGQRFGGAVAAAVVHIDDFRRQADQKEHGGEASVQLVERRHFVEERYDNRQLRRTVRITRHDEAPFPIDGREIVAHQGDAFADKQRAGLQAAEQVELLLDDDSSSRVPARSSSSSMYPGCTISSVTPGGSARTIAGKGTRVQNAGVNAANEMRRAQIVRCGRFDSRGAPMAASRC